MFWSPIRLSYLCHNFKREWKYAETISGEESTSGPVPRKYTVQPGDTLSKISERYYGYAERYMKIFLANRDQLDNPNLIQPGMVLVIPE